MKEHGILFKAPMVRAILEGRKTQTRRLMKFIPLEPGLNLQASSLTLQEYFKGRPEYGYVLASRGAGSCWNNRTKPLLPPYAVGDRLWVRETWAQNANQLSDEHMDTSYVYRADGEERALDNGGEKHWTPSIHMPRRASRITLEVTAVRAQRLQDISEQDAAAEGIVTIRRSVMKHGLMDGYGLEGTDPGETQTTRRYGFAALWESINGRGSWAANPYVWAYTFDRIKGGGR